VGKIYAGGDFYPCLGGFKKRFWLFAVRWKEERSRFKRISCGEKVVRQPFEAKNRETRSCCGRAPVWVSEKRGGSRRLLAREENGFSLMGSGTCFEDK